MSGQRRGPIRPQGPDVSGRRHGDPCRREPRPAQRDLWFCNVIEPNAWGAGGVRAAFWAAIHD